jgi:hypothetical protein
MLEQFGEAVARSVAIRVCIQAVAVEMEKKEQV